MTHFHDANWLSVAAMTKGNLSASDRPRVALESFRPAGCSLLAHSPSIDRVFCLSFPVSPGLQNVAGLEGRAPLSTESGSLQRIVNSVDGEVLYICDGQHSHSTYLPNHVFYGQTRFYCHGRHTKTMFVAPHPLDGHVQHFWMGQHSRTSGAASTC